MKKTFKRTVSMAMAAVMSVTMAGILPAAEEVDYRFDNFLESYFDTSLPNWLLENGYSDVEEYYVSNPVEYSDYLTGEIYGVYVFVFENDNIIAKLRTYKYDENDYIVFDQSIPKELQSMYDNGEEVVITADENYTFVVSETDSVALDVEDDAKMEKPVEHKTKIDKAKEIYVADPVQAYSASLGNYTIKGIVFKPNQQVYNEYVNGEFVLCWEACLAMKVNYLKGTNLSAMQVYKAIGSPDPHDGSVINNQKYIDTYAMYGVTIDCYNKTIPTTTLLDELRSNNPVDLHVSDLRNTSLAHAILLYGLNVYNDHTDYYILDPDFSSAYGKATVTTYGLPNESHKNFVYKTTYENRAESRQHEYKWKYTRY